MVTEGVSGGTEKRPDRGPARLVVYGAGGHGKVVADILLACGERVTGFVDDRAPPGEMVLGLPVLGPRAVLAGGDYRVALGIGDNSLRATVAADCLAERCELVTAVHPRAVVAASATLEEGVVVMALAVVNPGTTIGRGAIINTGAVVEHDCSVGAFAHVSPNATLGGGCRIGDLAQLGIGATMLPGRAVGARALVGGGSLVARDIEGSSVAKGVPARATRRVDGAR
jgi:sugar O-acyltransferase (sialic acid O-acetyltransferase NeuD family)